MSVPEPAPKKRGFDVSAALLQNHGITPQMGELIEHRRAFGMAKYGQSLYSNDGRNGLEDARQELGDLIQYVYKVFSPQSTEVHSVEEIRKFRKLWRESVAFIDSVMDMDIKK